MILSAKLGLEKTNLIAQNSSLEKRIKDISEKEDMCSNSNHGKVIATEIANPNVWDLRPKEVETPIITDDNETTSVNNGDEENNNEPIINDSDSQKEEIPNEDPITPEETPTINDKPVDGDEIPPSTIVDDDDLKPVPTPDTGEELATVNITFKI